MRDEEAGTKPAQEGDSEDEQAKAGQGDQREESATDGQRAEPPTKQVDQLAEQHQRLKDEVQRVRDQLLRARADYENFAKRAQRETQDAVDKAKGGILLRVVEAVESLEKGIELMEAKDQKTSGLQMVQQGLQKLLADEGVVPIETEGRPFDYNIHMAVERVETADAEPEVIVDTVQTGYMLGHRVLRPAMVRVASAPTAKEPEGGEDSGDAEE